MCIRDRYIRTNISSNEMLSLIGDIGTLMSGNLEQNRFPTDAQGQGKMIDGIDVYKRQFIYNSSFGKRSFL